MEYTSIALVVMAFFLLIAIALGIIYYKERKAGWAFAAYGVFLLTVLMFWSVLGVSMEDLSAGPCEWVISGTQEIYQYGNNFTGYHWDYDTGAAPDGPLLDAYIFHKNITNEWSYTCADRESFGVIENIYVVVTWFFYAMFWCAVLITVIYLVGMVRRRS